MHRRRKSVMSAFQSIVYVSSAIEPFTADALEALLLDAREFNRANDTTGVLLYSDGNFIQCIEGTSDAIEDTYARILESRRHRHIQELMNEPIAERAFEEWTMGCARVNTSELLALSTLRWRLMSKPHSAEVFSPGLELLRMFWSNLR
jgi:hypothetical protein